MAASTPVKQAQRLVRGAVTLPINLLHHAASEPLITGSILLALTRAPAQYRSRILKLFSDAGLSNERIPLVIKSLKFLLAIGVVRKLNQALNKLALNHYHLGKPGAPFKFGDAKKSELVVVTGGCSGFGYEMVKGFSKHARVIILDISPVPPELEKRESFSTFVLNSTDSRTPVPGVHYYQIDLTDFAAIESTAEEIRRQHGNPTVLVNNAGIGKPSTCPRKTSKNRGD